MAEKNHIDSAESSPEKVIDSSPNELIGITLTKQEWTIVYNVIARQEYRLGDAFLVGPILDKLQPVVAQLSSADIKPAPEVKIES